MMSGAHPFDAAALTYDEIFTQRRLGSWLREMVRERLPFQPGDHILELGCGTGEDALWLAQRGISVTAAAGRFSGSACAPGWAGGCRHDGPLLPLGDRLASGSWRNG